MILGVQDRIERIRTNLRDDRATVHNFTEADKELTLAADACARATRGISSDG